MGFWPIVPDEGCFRSTVRGPQFATTVLETDTWSACLCLTLMLVVKTIGRSDGGSENRRLNSRERLGDRVGSLLWKGCYQTRYFLLVAPLSPKRGAD
jgi:hypothetical protein